MSTNRESTKIRTLVAGFCFECDRPATHQHHVVPASLGGRRVVWLCEECHEMAHGFLEGQFALRNAGRRAKQKRGGYTGGKRFGGRRYGETLVEVDGKWEYQPIPEEQEVIRRICDFCANGKGYTSMARVLNTERVPTVTGARWSEKVVRDIALRHLGSCQ